MGMMKLDPQFVASNKKVLILFFSFLDYFPILGIDLRQCYNTSKGILLPVFFLTLILNCVTPPEPKAKLKPNLIQMVKAGDWFETQEFLTKNPYSI
jgi:ankyrin